MGEAHKRTKKRGKGWGDTLVKRGLQIPKRKKARAGARAGRWRKAGWGNQGTGVVEGQEKKTTGALPGGRSVSHDLPVEGAA